MDVRLVSIADKLYNARAILTDHFECGDKVFERFSGKKDGTLWYYRALVEAFRAAETRDAHDSADVGAGRRRLLDELERTVEQLEARCGGKGENPCRG